MNYISILEDLIKRVLKLMIFVREVGLFLSWDLLVDINWFEPTEFKILVLLDK